MPCFDLSSNSKFSDHFELIAIYKYFVYWSQKKKNPRLRVLPFKENYSLKYLTSAIQVNVRHLG